MTAFHLFLFLNSSGQPDKHTTRILEPESLPNKALHTTAWTSRLVNVAKIHAGSRIVLVAWAASKLERWTNR